MLRLEQNNEDPLAVDGYAFDGSRRRIYLLFIAEGRCRVAKAIGPCRWVQEGHRYLPFVTGALCDLGTELSCMTPWAEARIDVLDPG